MRGVKKVVPVGDKAVAVVADTFWNAKTAVAALPIVWDDGPNANVSSASIADMLKEGLDAYEAFVGNKAGDAAAAIAGAAKKVEAVYSYPYQNHATMEPMNATALYTADKCEVWCPTQNGEAALAAVAEASGLPVAKCEVYKQLCGGGFGRRGRSDYVEQAVLIAKQMPGTPVKLIWTREEDMTHCSVPSDHAMQDDRRPRCRRQAGRLAYAHLRPVDPRLAGAAESAETGWTRSPSRGSIPAGRRVRSAISVPNLLIDHAMRNPPITAGFWRGVNINHNAIYVECFIDELAHAAGQDPLEFRRKMLKPNHFAVLKAAADKAGLRQGAGREDYHGLAQIMGFGSYVAACAEVSVSQEGRLKIHRICAATDPGHAVNPAQIERQVAGSFVYGLSALLYGECTVEGGAIEQTNFDTYNVMRIDEMPQGRGRHHAVGRLLGRRRRADHRRRGAGGAQRDLRGDRQAHPHRSR